ncbi:unnamed protein product, partial [Porites evermanni]
EPREAFFGGQTGAVALHAVAGEGEEIRYVDVTSLYPWENKNCPYPIGHPQIITQPVDQSLGSYFGIATVNILPPAGLFHPVLPVCSGQKLTFPLCCSCVQEEQAKPMLNRTHYCPHCDADRTLRGTWCTPELVKASLDTLQQQVLYYDTDSVVYKWRPGQPSIAIGDFLGDMTDELDGDVITEFVSGGAENYGYQT